MKSEPNQIPNQEERSLLARSPDLAERVLSVIAMGKLSKLSTQEKAVHYQNVCTSMGLNYLTHPLDYLSFNGKEMLYVNKDGTAQLRRIYKISVVITSREMLPNGSFVVTARASTPDGRTDESIGAVAISKSCAGEMLANLIMKAETKAKRRVTLSICGLGFLDESEVETMTTQSYVPAKQLPERTPEARPVITLQQVLESNDRTNLPSQGDMTTGQSPGSSPVVEIGKEEAGGETGSSTSRHSHNDTDGKAQPPATSKKQYDNKPEPTEGTHIMRIKKEMLSKYSNGTHGFLLVNDAHEFFFWATDPEQRKLASVIQVTPHTAWANYVGKEAAFEFGRNQKGNLCVRSVMSEDEAKRINEDIPF